MARAGHVSASYKEFLYILGGYGESVCEPDLFEYNTRTDVWQRYPSRNAHHVPAPYAPKRLSGSAMLVYKSFLVVFGGFALSEPEMYPHKNDLYIFDLKKKQWLSVSKEGVAPPPPAGGGAAAGAAPLAVDGSVRVYGEYPPSRDKHSMVVYKDTILLFGGWSTKGPHNPIPDENFSLETGVFRSMRCGWNNQLFALDMSRLVSDRIVTWSIPATSGTTPLPRAAHTMNVMGDKAYMFGGRTQLHRVNDVFQLDLETMTWSEIIVEGAVPPPRSWHCSVGLNNHELFVFGGLSAEVSQDIPGAPMTDGWILDVRKKAWKEVTPTSLPPIPRLWHTCNRVSEGARSNLVYIFGGKEKSREADDLPIMDVFTNTLIVFRHGVPSLKSLAAIAVASRPETLKCVGILPESLQGLVQDMVESQGHKM